MTDGREYEATSAHAGRGAVVSVLAVLSVISIAGAAYCLTLPSGKLAGVIGFLISLITFAAIFVSTRGGDSVSALNALWVWVVGAVALGYGLGSAVANGTTFDGPFFVGFIVGGALVGAARALVWRFAGTARETDH